MKRRVFFGMLAGLVAGARKVLGGCEGLAALRWSVPARSVGPFMISEGQDNRGRRWVEMPEKPADEVYTLSYWHGGLELPARMVARAGERRYLPREAERLMVVRGWSGTPWTPNLARRFPM